MATIYMLPTQHDRVYQIRDEVLRKWHQRLHEAQVRVGILFAANPDGPAIKKGGYKVLALVGPLSLKWRVLTSLDALITIDEDQWKDLDDDSQVAVIDHELSHLDTVEEDNGFGGVRLKRDDIGRPKLQSVDGDWNGGDGFVEVIKRHGEAAIELINARRAHSIAAGALEETLQGAE